MNTPTSTATKTDGSNGFSDRHTNYDGNKDGDAYEHSHEYADQDSYSREYTYFNGNQDGYANGFSDRHTDEDSNGDQHTRCQ